jgi:hypothetical protein
MSRDFKGPIVLPPYRPDEIATALMEAARGRGSSPDLLEVVANEAAGIWIIRARGHNGKVGRLTFPFSSPQGIYTPAEIAAHLMRGSWPFG